MNVPALHYQLALMRAREVQARAETAWRLPPPRPPRQWVGFPRRRRSPPRSQPIKGGV
jgi:hypothetical protein